jgi:prepilin-type N-terminal cleavage/methylation domain-containing protein
MTRRSRSESGFTLIELMVAVVIVVILATVAAVAYIRHLRQGRIVEGRAFISSIASRQEAYFQRYGYYCDASQADTAYPALASGEPVAKAWAPASTTGWAVLNVRPEKDSTYFQVTCRASDPNSSHALFSRASTLGIPDQPTVTGSTPFAWYYIYAEADFDGRGSPYTTLYSTSARSEIVIQNEGQ